MWMPPVFQIARSLNTRVLPVDVCRDLVPLRQGQPHDVVIVHILFPRAGEVRVLVMEGLKFGSDRR